MSNAQKVVKLDTFAITVKQLIEEYVYRIDLEADYQREKIWPTSKQQLLLDSILNDIDIPKLYLAEVEDNKQFDYECIDGKQRMVTLLTFLRPESERGVREPLRLPIFNREYTYQELSKELPKLAKKIDAYKLDFVCYDFSATDDASADRLVRDIFRRLQLGVQLNSGERLNALLGTIRDFIFKELGAASPFIRNTGISSKRFSREFTLAQIALNSFKRETTGDFARTRLSDLEDFFNDQADMQMDDPNLKRITHVLETLDRTFGNSAANISSKAAAVSAFLFAEDLHREQKANWTPTFVEFYLKLLDEVKKNMELIKKYKNAENPQVMEGFQKYILQASVEPSAIRRRHNFLTAAFAYYTDPKTKGQLLGSKSNEKR